MTPAEEAELRRLHSAYVAAEKRLNDAIDAVERVRDELLEGRRALLVLMNSTPPRAEEEIIPLWRLPSGPVA